MFISVKFRTVEGIDYYEPININYIKQIRYANIKDVDAGCLIMMKDGTPNWTPDTMDVIEPALNKVWRESISLLLGQIAIEQAENILYQEERERVLKPKRKYVKKKK